MRTDKGEEQKSESSGQVHTPHEQDEVKEEEKHMHSDGGSEAREDGFGALD